MACHHWWNHEFCTLSENPEGECPAVSLWSQAQAHLGYAAGQWSQTHQQVHFWNLKQSFHARKPSNVAELKKFCIVEWAGIPPQRCERLLVITNTWLQLLLQRVSQPVIRLLCFHVGAGRFGQLFSINKLDHYFKTAFCIYVCYLCVILKFVWWSESFKCDKYAKK